MKFTHLAFAIASLGGVVAMAVAAPAHADLKWNGPVLNGINLNGPVLNGMSTSGAQVRVESCRPTTNRVCEPRVRAVILPSGQRMGLK